MKIVLAITTLVFAIEWIKCKICALAALHFIYSNGIEFPKEVYQKHIEAVIKHWFKLDRNEP